LTPVHSRVYNSIDHLEVSRQSTGSSVGFPSVGSYFDIRSVMPGGPLDREEDAEKPPAIAERSLSH
jgi:hypothetical protein